MAEVQFQGRTFAANVRDDGLLEVRYNHGHYSGHVAARSLDRLPALLKIQSDAADGAELYPCGGVAP